MGYDEVATWHRRVEHPGSIYCSSESTGCGTTRGAWVGDLDDPSVLIGCYDEENITSFSLDVTMADALDDGRVAWAGSFTLVGKASGHSAAVEGTFDLLLEPAE